MASFIKNANSMSSLSGAKEIFMLVLLLLLRIELEGDREKWSKTEAVRLKCRQTGRDRHTERQTEIDE